MILSERKVERRKIFKRAKLNVAKLNEMWKKRDELGDITLIFNKTKFKAHKILLMGRSDYFFSMFDQNWAEKEMVEIELPNPHEVSTESFIIFMKKLYRQEEIIDTWDRFSELYLISNYFHVDFIKEQVYRFLKRSIKCGSVKMMIQTLKLSQELNDNALFKLCVTHFSFIKNYEDFCRGLITDEKLFESVLKSDLLCVNEKYMYSLVKDWIRVNKIQDKEEIIRLFGLVRFEIMKPGIVDNFKYDLRMKFGLVEEQLDEIYKLELPEYRIHRPLQYNFL